MSTAADALCVRGHTGRHAVSALWKALCACVSCVRDCLVVEAACSLQLVLSSLWRCVVAPFANLYVLFYRVFLIRMMMMMTAMYGWKLVGEEC